MRMLPYRPGAGDCGVLGVSPPNPARPYHVTTHDRRYTTRLRPNDLPQMAPDSAEEADHAERTGRVRDWVARIGGCRWPGGSSSGASTSRAWMDGATAWLTVDCRRAPAHSRESWVRTLEIGTYVGDRYARWRSVRMLEIHAPCNSNGCAFVQRVYITPTPARAGSRVACPEPGWSAH